MKKIAYISSLVSVLILASGVAFAATNTARPVTEYTAKQQSCINSDLKAGIKPAQDAFNAATKNALKAKQDAMKPATDALNNATKDALKARQDAIKAAQKITDKVARATAIKAANDEYNNDATVKKAQVPYMAAMKAANDVFNSDPSVKQARIPYTAAVKALRADAIKKCTGVSFLSALKNIFEESTSALIRAFTFVK